VYVHFSKVLFNYIHVHNISPDENEILDEMSSIHMYMIVKCLIDADSTNRNTTNSYNICCEQA